MSNFETIVWAFTAVLVMLMLCAVLVNRNTSRQQVLHVDVAELARHIAAELRRTQRDDEEPRYGVRR